MLPRYSYNSRFNLVTSQYMARMLTLFFSIIVKNKVVLILISLLHDTILKYVLRYVKSRNDVQLRLKSAESKTGQFCKPQATTSNGSVIVPCGLIAWSLFNDTFKFSSESQVLEVSKKDIAWKSDQDLRFGSDVFPENFQSEGLIGGARLNSSIPVSATLICFPCL